MASHKSKHSPALLILCAIVGLIILIKLAWIIVPGLLAGAYLLGKKHGTRKNKAVTRLRAERDNFKARVTGLNAEVSRLRDIAHAAWDRSAEPEPEPKPEPESEPEPEDDLVSRLLADPLSGVRRLGSARARHGQSV